MTVRSGVYAFVATVVVLVAGLAYFQQNYSIKDGSVAAKTKAEKKGGKKAEDKDEAVPVRVEKAQRGSIASHVVATANLRALRNVALLARTEGRVENVSAEEGDYVKKGQILCQIDDRELQINLELARQKLAQTKVQLESARIQREKIGSQIAAKRNELTRNEEALKEGLVSDTDVELFRNQLAELGHDERAQEAAVRENTYRVEELTAEIEKVELQISHTNLTAPFSGRIVERTIELGQSVRANDPAFKLAAFSPLYADVFISDSDSRRVKRGQAVTVSLDAASTETSEGKVVRISPVVDDSTGTVKVTTELRPSAASLRPGAFVRVRIKTDTVNNAVLIPKSALIEEDGETYVFVNDGETAHRKLVELGYEDGASVEVRSGVGEGDQIVVAGQGSLKEGDKTKVVEG